MYDYSLMQRIRLVSGTFQGFSCAVIITDPELQVYWSNDAARMLFPSLTGTQGLRAALADFQPAALYREVGEKGGVTLGDIPPMSGCSLHLAPLHLEGKAEALVVLPRDPETAPVFRGADHTGGAPAALARGLRRSVEEMFQVMDEAAEKADILDMGWINSRFADIGSFGYRMLRLTDNIAEFSRYQADMLLLRRETVDCFDLLRSMEDTVCSLARGAGTPLAFHLPREDSVPVSLDLDRFHLMLMNVLHNSLYFTRPDNRVDLYAEVQDHQMVLRVEDRGTGIPEEVLPRVFRPWFAWNREGLPETAGLGLSLARVLAEAHGGSLILDSRWGAGTQVTITLPPASLYDALPMAQGTGASPYANRFSRVYTGLMDASLTPYGDRKP